MLSMRWNSALLTVGLVWSSACGDDGTVVTDTNTSSGSSTGDAPGTDTGAPTSAPSTDPPTSTSGMTGGDDASSSGAVDPTTGATTSGETTAGDTSSGDTSTGTTGCAIGSEGCDCGPGDACDDPLVCVDGLCEQPGAECGNGVVEAGEDCDDQNPDNTDECLDTCAAASCGDGFVQAGVEACDDMNPDNTDECLDTCAAASCGDGFVQAGVEACDDMNPDNTDACLDTCAAAACGDGFVQAGVEDCDDQNPDNTDACLDTCAAASCGDGFVQAGVEQCDDGNGVDDDECTNACQVNNDCVEGKGCLVVVSNSLGVANIYEPTTLTLLDSYPGLSNAQSVAVGGNGKLYVGQGSVVRTVDLATKATADIGAGLVQGNLYGATVKDDRAYFSGSGMATIRVLSLAGADMGTIASPGGQNLRSTAFGPQGEFYLSSFGGGPMQRWNPGLVYVGTFNGGGLATAFGVTTRSNADVVVTGQDQAAYYVFDKLGVFKKKVAVACVGQLRNIAADAADTLYVTCYENNRVVVFNAADQPTGMINIATPAGVDVLPSL
ncbi:MAG: DUF4215 domain-containing protein [Myxococcales bacterium]|nr:DUF4215 domain-containing protein [Myxococcales bacterium]